MGAAGKLSCPAMGRKGYMFKVMIGAIPVLMAKFFSPSDRDAVLGALPQGARRVVFIDTPATEYLVATLEALVAQGVDVVVRDHHDAPARSNPREVAIADAAERVRELLGGNAVVSNRAAHPACSGLVAAGEFAGEGTVIVADPDPDGLLGAMKAAGVVYDGLDQDADVLDGGRAGQTAERLTPNALLLTRAMASLPPFDAARPQVSEEAKGKLFADFVAMVGGDPEARARLERGVEAYEAGVAEARRLAATVQEILPGVVIVDVTASPRFDLGTLAAAMEARPGVVVTVQKKSFGPIAANHGGVQFSLAVVKARQAEVNLQEMLPAGFTSSLEAGVISNTTFLLHVSQKVWVELILPALWGRFYSSTA